MRDKAAKTSALTVFTYQPERHTMTRQGGCVLTPGSVLLTASGGAALSTSNHKLDYRVMTVIKKLKEQGCRIKGDGQGKSHCEAEVWAKT